MNRAVLLLLLLSLVAVLELSIVSGQSIPLPTLSDKNPTLVFVYGTLKRDRRNYGVYIQPAIEMHKAAFVATAMTATSDLCLVVGRDSVDDSIVPCMFEHASCANEPPIRGELFVVDDDALHALDALEGIASGNYYRREIQVRVDSSSQVMRALVYLKTFDQALMLPQRTSDYTKAMDVAATPANANYEPDLEGLGFLYGHDKMHAIKALMKQQQHVPFHQAWLQVIGRPFLGRPEDPKSSSLCV